MEIFFEINDNSLDEIVFGNFLGKRVNLLRRNLFIEVDKNTALEILVWKNDLQEFVSTLDGRMFIHPYLWIHLLTKNDPGQFVRLMIFIDHKRSEDNFASQSSSMALSDSADTMSEGVDFHEEIIDKLNKIISLVS